ncbi:PIG-L family deacetylase [Nocardia sp. NPDC050793]|uniref:PIG-L deacetylase family protein n=1 Tax=Nocardia sp. NPDC050793 TaxID=3155159 RepID=UPI0033E7CC83
MIAPHPDDEVIGCGGLISRVKREGGQVHVLYVAVDDLAEYSPAGRSTIEQRMDEIEQVAKFLSLDSWDVPWVGEGATLGLDTVARAKIVRLLEGPGHRLALSTLRPTVVVAPEITSFNQDHQAIGQAVLTALRPGSDQWRHQPSLVLAYEQVGDFWSGAAVAPQSRNFFVALDDADVDRKIAALGLHVSQWREHPHTRSEQALRGLAAMRGAHSGVPCAEAFHCLRWRG